MKESEPTPAFLGGWRCRVLTRGAVEEEPAGRTLLSSAWDTRDPGLQASRGQESSPPCSRRAVDDDRLVLCGEVEEAAVTLRGWNRVEEVAVRRDDRAGADEIRRESTRPGRPLRQRRLRRTSLPDEVRQPRFSTTLSRACRLPRRCPYSPMSLPPLPPPPQLRAPSRGLLRPLPRLLLQVPNWTS